MGIKVFLDMDGVLVDFMGGLHTALGVEYSPHDYPYEVSKYDIFEDLCKRTNGRVSMDNLYRVCDAASFWENLHWHSTGKEIYKLVCDLVPAKDIFICTAPMAHPDAWAGKVSWIKKNLGMKKNIVIMAAPKHLLAKPGCVLIDDKDSNIKEFIQAGGRGYLVPQPWNAARAAFNEDYIPTLKKFMEGQVGTHDFQSSPYSKILSVLGL